MMETCFTPACWWLSWNGSTLRKSIFSEIFRDTDPSGCSTPPPTRTFTATDALPNNRFYSSSHPRMGGVSCRPTGASAYSLVPPRPLPQLQDDRDYACVFETDGSDTIAWDKRTTRCRVRGSVKEGGGCPLNAIVRPMDQFLPFQPRA